MIIAALLVIPALILQESGLGEPALTIGFALNAVIWAAFAVEFATMMIVTPRRWEWIRHHPLDVVIVLFTSPFMPASWQAARMFRLLRVARLFRVFSMRNLISLEGIKAAAFVAAFVVVGGGAVFAAVERGSNPAVNSTFDGVWWAVTTVTTVGYGDISPTTDAGRMIGMMVMLVGIGFVALFTAYIAERFVNASKTVSEHEKALLAELQTISARLHRLEADAQRDLGSEHGREAAAELTGVPR
jgi:voltage-gated potassium channel